MLDRSDTFRVHTDVYMDREVFEAEIRNIFERTWVYVAHESEIAAVGGYKTSIIGRQPIIVSRHEDGEVHVLLNRSRQRGAVVCRVGACGAVRGRPGRHRPCGRACLCDGSGWHALRCCRGPPG